MVEPPSYLPALLASTHATELASLVAAFDLDLDALLALKIYSAQFYLADPPQALAVARKAYALSLLLPAPASALGGWTLANALVFTEEFTEAVACYADAYAQYVACDDRLNAARLGVGYVGALAYTGKPAHALQLAAGFASCLAASSAEEDQQRLASLYMNMGVCQELLGRYEEAVATYELQFSLATQMGRRLLAAQARQNQAQAFAQVNADHEALAAFAIAEETMRAEGAHADLARLHINRSLVLMRMRNYGEALAAVAAARAELDALSAPTVQQQMLTRVQAEIMLASGRPVNQALLDALHVAQTAFEANGPVYEAILTSITLSRVLRLRGELSGAQRVLDSALPLLDENHAHVLAPQLWHESGLVAYATGALGAARNALRHAIDAAEQLRLPLRQDFFRSTFLADKMTIYQDLAHLYAINGEVAAALHYVDRAKSRLLTEQLAFRSDQEERTSTAALGDVEVDRQLSAVEALYHRLALAERARDSAAVTAPLLAAIARAEAEVIGLIRRREVEKPNTLPLPLLHWLPEMPSVAWDMPTGTALVSYYIADGCYHALVRDASDTVTHVQLARTDAVSTATEALHVAVQRMLALAVQLPPAALASFAPALEANAVAHLQTLYGYLLAPVAAQLNGVARLGISPIGELYAVPFHALHDGQHYLVERRPSFLLPSVQVAALSHPRPERSSAPQVALFGYDDGTLGAVAAEIDTLSRYWPTAGRYVQDQATVARVRSATAAQLIHLATHARFRHDAPMLSTLTLADRGLTLAEIERMHLAAELVILSACETGAGVVQGADLVTLAAGFLGAGARALVASLWRVDDKATAMLMSQLHAGLASGLPPAGALQAAQRSMLNERTTPPSSPWRHPAFWAGFSLIGDDGPPLA